MKRVHSKWPRQTVQAFVISPHNGPPPVLALSTYIFLEENTTKLGGETSSYDGILLKCVLTSVSQHLFFCGQCTNSTLQTLENIERYLKIGEARGIILSKEMLRKAQTNIV